MKRSIVYVLGAYPVWSETFLRQDLTGLLEAGVPLISVSLFPGDCEVRPDWPRVACLRPAASCAGKGAATAWSRLSRRLPRRAATSLSLWRHRAVLRELVRVIQNREAVHVHGEFADLPGLLAATAARRCGCSYSLGVHARDVHAGKFTLNSLYAGVRFVTVCNQAAATTLVRARPRLEDRIQLLYHGLDMRQWPYEAEGEDASTGSGQHLLIVGRFVEKKGIDLALRSVRLRIDAGDDVRLTLIGDGPLAGSLRRQAQALDINAQLEWTGVVSRDEVRHRLQRADVLLVPSRVAFGGDRDGIPNVVLEAMAVGTPVAGSTVGGLGEVLNESTGWPFPADDADALSRTLHDIRRQREARHRRCRAARELIEARFDARLLAERRAALFRQVLEPPPPTV